jgi:hypothetical protein
LHRNLTDHAAPAELKDGRVLFGMTTTRCRVSEQPGRCLLPLSSQERNVVRTVVEFAESERCLRLDEAAHEHGETAVAGKAHDRGVRARHTE